MLLIREVMYCKPGKVRAMVEKNLAMAKLSEESGLGKMRTLTDFCAERYWTIVTEYEVPSMQAFEEMMKGEGQSPEVGKQFERSWRATMISSNMGAGRSTRSRASRRVAMSG